MNVTFTFSFEEEREGTKVPIDFVQMSLTESEKRKLRSLKGNTERRFEGYPSGKCTIDMFCVTWFLCPTKRTIRVQGDTKRNYCHRPSIYLRLPYQTCASLLFSVSLTKTI